MDVKHGLYSHNGEWYHYLKVFPGAYFDQHGYVIFHTKEDFDACRALDLGQTVHVPGGISSIGGYVKMQ